jgi:hypothetical protein
MEKQNRVWTPLSSPIAPKGYVYKMMRINKDFIDNEKTKLLKDNDLAYHNWPVVRQGKYKGYIGINNYLIVKVKLK